MVYQAENSVIRWFQMSLFCTYCSAEELKTKTLSKTKSSKRA